MRQAGYATKQASCAAGAGRSFLVGGLLLLVCAGCSPVETRFEVVSFKDPTLRDQYSEKFPAGYFSVNAHRDYAIVFELEQGTGGTGQPAEAPMSQILRIEMFWKPRPGTTYAESSQTNANISYCLISGNNAISYEGAGFVYFDKSYDGKEITGKIESGTLVPAHFMGEPTDIFGPCHVQGKFVAREDRRKTVEAEQRLRNHRGRNAS